MSSNEGLDPVIRTGDSDEKSHPSMGYDVDEDDFKERVFVEDSCVKKQKLNNQEGQSTASCSTSVETTSSEPIQELEAQGTSALLEVGRKCLICLFASFLETNYNFKIDLQLFDNPGVLPELHTIIMTHDDVTTDTGKARLSSKLLLYVKKKKRERKFDPFRIFSERFYFRTLGISSSRLSLIRQKLNNKPKLQCNETKLQRKLDRLDTLIFEEAAGNPKSLEVSFLETNSQIEILPGDDRNLGGQNPPLSEDAKINRLKPFPLEQEEETWRHI